jgi:hypothetical protein
VSLVLLVVKSEQLSVKIFFYKPGIDFQTLIEEYVIYFFKYQIVRSFSLVGNNGFYDLFIKWESLKFNWVNMSDIETLPFDDFYGLKCTPAPLF